VTFGERRAYAGKILELNFLRSPLSRSTRLSLTLGALRRIVPDPTVNPRSRACPLRTTSRLFQKPERYAVFVLKPSHDIWVYLGLRSTWG
jgi:hypothetical protein